MGGFFGAVKKEDAVSDVFFGTDYHSHLGTSSGGMAAFNNEIGLQREIHNISSTPFRTKFAADLERLSGHAAIGCINDTSPQPLLARSRFGAFAISVVGVVNNKKELIGKYLRSNYAHFDAMTGGVVNVTELIAALISEKDNFVDGIRYAQDQIDGSLSILILTQNGTIIAARDKFGRTPVLIGKSEADDGFCVAFESFAYQKLEYTDYKELGPGEIVEITADEVKTLAEPHKKNKICTFLWTYYGYPTSNYEGVNVEVMRYRNGQIMAQNDKKNGLLPEDLDYVGGVPDSGTPHAIG
ncbi:MAG: amidophosphoribosyltransferase, partial [Clostridia bacterium]|nr:amidophosphoribosyltransferase [Clostridia bacterium]